MIELLQSRWEDHPVGGTAAFLPATVLQRLLREDERVSGCARGSGCSSTFVFPRRYPIVPSVEPSSNMWKRLHQAVVMTEEATEVGESRSSISRRGELSLAAGCPGPRLCFAEGFCRQYHQERFGRELSNVIVALAGANNPDVAYPARSQLSRRHPGTSPGTLRAPSTATRHTRKDARRVEHRAARRGARPSASRRLRTAACRDRTHQRAARLLMQRQACEGALRRGSGPAFIGSPSQAAQTSRLVNNPHPRRSLANSHPPVNASPGSGGLPVVARDVALAHARRVCR